MRRVELQKADTGSRSKCVWSEIPLDASSLSKVIASHSCIGVGRVQGLETL